MYFRQLRPDGVWLIDPERVEDERGFFARAWCRAEFAGRGIPADWAQGGISFNPRRGTLRGLHFQAPPHAEAKLVRCTRGAAFHVAVDLRPGSPDRLAWSAVELTAENRRLLYVPEGFAHGFQTLADDTELYYQISAPYHPPSVRGVRWDDPALAIDWPDCPRRIIAPHDLAFSLLAV